MTEQSNTCKFCTYRCDTILPQQDSLNNVTENNSQQRGFGNDIIDTDKRAFTSIHSRFEYFPYDRELVLEI